MTISKEGFPKKEKSAREIELAKDIEKVIGELNALTDEFEGLQGQDQDFFTEQEKDDFFKNNEKWEPIISKYQKGEYDEQTLEKLVGIRKILRGILNSVYKRHEKTATQKTFQKNSQEPINLTELQVDIAGTEAKTSGRVYKSESAPHDALEKAQRIKYIKQIEKLFKEEADKKRRESEIEEELRIGEIEEKHKEEWEKLREEEIKEATGEKVLTDEEKKIQPGLRTPKERQIEINRIFAEDELKIKKGIEKMHPTEREKIGIGLRNIGFFVQEWKSRIMAGICGKFAGEKEDKGTINRFFSSLTETYKKDGEAAKKKIAEREKSAGLIKRFQNAGYLTGNILKYGRTVADVIGWTAGSPLRYVMLGAQFFSRGAEAAKEARLKNEEVIEKTRIKDIDEAAEEAWRIYETAKAKSETGITKEALERAYIKNLPKDILKRLEKSEPGMATGILQKILKRDVEWAIKRGKFSEASFEKRLKEYDRLVSQYGTVDALALGAKYAETAGKAVIAGVSMETAALGIRSLFNNLPAIMHKLNSFFEISIEAPIKAPPESIISITPKPEIIPETITAKPAFESIVEVHKGDTVWKLTEKQLAEKGYFKDLKGTPEEILAKKTHLIDAIKDKIVANPKTYGISSGDADIIKVGEKIDFNDIFGNKDTAAQLNDKGDILESEQNEQKPEITIGASKNVFELFDRQSQMEKWRTIQIYQNDIDSIKQNLAKFKDPDITASIQKEIDRLENVKMSLIKKLADQTEQINQIMPAKEKVEFLNDLIYKDTRFAEFKVDALAEQIKAGKLTVEDFARYYADKIGAKEAVNLNKLTDNLKENFKNIIEGTDRGGLKRKAVENLLNHLRKE